MTQKTYFAVTGILFLIIMVVHAVRLMMEWNVVVGGFAVPLWFSVAGALLAGFLSYAALRLVSIEK